MYKIVLRCYDFEFIHVENIIEREFFTILYMHIVVISEKTALQLLSL